MKRVAIVGFGPTWVEAPFGDDAVDIWAMNYHHEQLPRVTCLFELHAWSLLEQEGPEHLASLAALTVPVYMQDVRPEVPTSLKYPLARMRERFLLRDAERPYFTSTASYMIALAIEEGYTAIDLYGLDMSYDSEYGTQRPSCEFLLGIAVGRGIAVRPHPSSDLLKTAFLYAYEDGPRSLVREKLLARRAELAQMHAQHTQEAARHSKAAMEFGGGIQNTDYLIRVLT